jgi:hypothetical protein
LLTSANKCVRSHLSDSATSARVGIAEDIRKKMNQETRKPRKE